MKKSLNMIIIISMISFQIKNSKADFWGGDIPLLTQIVFNTLQQLHQLRAILSNERDTLGLLRDVNSGIKEAMNIIKTMNTSIKGGIYTNYQNPKDLMNALVKLYGAVPNTSEGALQISHDQSVSEAITLHNQAFQYADTIDPEAERIKDYSRVTSPVGSARLTAQSLGVLIHVSNQILRTNAAMLKIMSENLALQNRHEKLNSTQFKIQYDHLSKSFKEITNMNQELQLNFNQKSKK